MEEKIEELIYKLENFRKSKEKYNSEDLITTNEIWLLLDWIEEQDKKIKYYKSLTKELFNILQGDSD